MQTGGTKSRVTIRFSGLPSSGFIINKGQSYDNNKKNKSLSCVAFHVAEAYLTPNHTQTMIELTLIHYWEVRCEMKLLANISTHTHNINISDVLTHTT